MARIGLVVKRLREERNMSQMKLAKAAGLEGAHVSQIEAGLRAHLRFETVAALCVGLGISLDAFAQLCGVVGYAESPEPRTATMARLERDAREARKKLQRAVDAYDDLDELLRKR